MAAIGQLDHAAGGSLPGFDAAQWQPPSRAAVKSVVAAGPYDYHRVYDTTDAVAWAVLDLKAIQQVDPAGVPFYRWIWIPPHGDVTWVESNSFLVNSAVSQANLIVLPDVVSGGWLIRWDLRKLAPKPDDLRRLLIVWNALAINEPFFHAAVSKSLGGSVASPAYVHIDGKTYHGRSFVPAPHVEPGYSLLERETSLPHAPSFAPLVRADDFLRRMASVYEGGLYYHAIGFVRDGHPLSEAEIFKLVGLDVLLSRKVSGDDRAGMFQSGVTGKPRTVEQVQGAIGLARITYDIFDTDNDASRHAIYNLLNGVEKARGKELIFERANGMLGYFLTDGKGKLLVDQPAPQELVTDHAVPSPHGANLFPPISCIRCHGPSGGVQPVRNDVAKLLSGGNENIDFFDDLSSKQGRLETVDQIAGQYAAGDKFQQDLERSRNTLADAVFRATKGSGVRGAEGVVQRASANIAKQYADYWYAKSNSEGNVNAASFLLDLGYRVKPADAPAVLGQVMPKRRIDVLIDGRPVEFADPALEALKLGMTIRRQDANRIFPYAAYQAVKARSE